VVTTSYIGQKYCSQKSIIRTFHQQKKNNKDPFGFGPTSDQLLLLLDQGMEILKPCGPLLWLVTNGGKFILPPYPFSRAPMILSKSVT
jgi:hypothetical protein